MGATAKGLLMEDDRCEGLLVRPDGGTFPIRAPATIGCFGRHGIAATHLGWIAPGPGLNKVSI